MKYVEIHKEQVGKFTEEQIERLKDFTVVELEDALAMRKPMEAVWRDCLRMYEGVPREPIKDYPVLNAPNIELTLSAIAADALYSQIVDLIFATTPLCTVQPVPKSDEDQELVDSAKALQRFLNWGAANEAKIKDAMMEGSLDFVQLGTKVYYVPWVERQKKTKTSKVLSAHPVVRSWPIEDFIVPSGACGDVQEMPWIAFRYWPTLERLKQEALSNKWNMGPIEDRIKSCASRDWVNQRREVLGKQAQGAKIKGKMFEIYKFHGFFDIDADGVEEELYWVFDRTAKQILHVSYDSYDYRPCSAGQYQKRAHMFWGLGAVEMIKPYQEGATNFYNYWILNSLQANTKDFFAKDGVLPDNWKRYPGKVTQITGDPMTDIREVQVHSTDASLPNALSISVSFAERRVGVNEMNTPRPSQVLGSRTPGITAMTLLQQVNKRFTPVFETAKGAVVDAMKQWVYRYQEQILANQQQVKDHIVDVLGIDDGMRVVALLSRSDFDEAVQMELTASSASLNRESDRQNSIVLMNIMFQYYQRCIELTTLVSNPQIPQPVRDVAVKIATASGELLDRTLRTFDSLRDPGAFILDFEEQLNQNVQGVAGPELLQLIQLLSQGGAGGEAALGGNLLGAPGGE